MKEDIVDDIFERVEKILGDQFSCEIAVKLDGEKSNVRKHFGGNLMYVRKKESRSKQKIIINAELRKGKRVDEISRKTGISRAGIYNLLKQKI